MLAQRLPPLWVFAGGCLSGALLLSWWHEDMASKHRPRADRPAELTTASALAPAMDEGADEVREPAHREPSASAPATTRNHDTTAASTAASSKDDKANGEVDGGPATDSGSSVAEVLARLEAAYRQGLPPTPAAPAPSVPTTAASVAAVPAPTVTATATATALPVAVAAPVAAPPTAAPVVVAPVVAYVPPVVVAAPAVAPVAAPPIAPANVAGAPSPLPSNVSIGTVHQGDLYQIQQQLALMQYMQYLPALPYGGYGAPAYGSPGYAPPASRHPQPKRVPYPSTLTNPDNPWGYDFPNALWNVR